MMSNMNISTVNLNNTNHSLVSNISDSNVSNPWKESGALVYIALTVLTFSALLMCFVWSWTKYRNSKSKYSTVVDDDSEEDIELTLNEEPTIDDTTYKIHEGEKTNNINQVVTNKIVTNNNSVIEDSEKFTLQCSSDENDDNENDDDNENNDVDIHQLI